MCKEKTIAAIQSGATSLGIEFGSTRIKAVLINDEHETIASGSHEWENRLENGIWTYSLEDIWNGLQDSYRNLRIPYSLTRSPYNAFCSSVRSSSIEINASASW